MADLLLAAAPPAPVADAVTGADLDDLLDAVTAIKAQQKELEQQLEPLLEALNTAMASGQPYSLPPFPAHSTCLVFISGEVGLAALVCATV